MTLTHENIHAAETPNGSFNWRQLKLLGVATPPRRGWLRALIGTEIPDATYAELVALRTAMHREKQQPLFPDTVALETFPEIDPDGFAGYQLPPAPEKPRESPAKERELGYVVMRDGSTAPLTAKSGISVAMKIPIELVETVQGLIRLRDSLARP